SQEGSERPAQPQPDRFNQPRRGALIAVITFTYSRLPGDVKELKRRRRRLFRIELKDRIDGVRLELLPAAEKLQLDDEGALDHGAADFRDQLGGRRGGAAGGDQVVGDHHARAGMNRVDVNFQAVGAVLQRVARLVRFV